MKYLFLIISCSTYLLGCQREVLVKDVNFDVTIDHKSYKAGDTVVFNFVGNNPDIITFYSGDGMSDYHYLQEDKYVDIQLVLSFQSAKFAGTNEDCAQLKYSTDFSGAYNEDAINAADWIDISDRFAIPPIVGTGPSLSSSGKQDITALFEDTDTPIYLGWFYNIPDRILNTDNRRTRFRVQAFNIDGAITEDPNYSQSLYDFNDLAFTIVNSRSYDEAPPTGGVPDNQRSRFDDVDAPSYIIFDGPFVNEVHRESWAITRPIYRPDKVNIGRATGVAIKAFNSPIMENHKYMFEKPGTYLVTFVAQNVNIYDNKKVVRQLEIVVEE